MKKKAGRPRVNIDWVIVEKYAKQQLPGTAIADIIGIHPDTLEKAIKKEFKTALSAYLQQKRETGKEKLRSWQFDQAENGNTPMLIWLGKQYLGQTDKQEITHDIDAIEIIINRKINEV